MEVTANKMDYSTAEALLGKLGAETTAARSVTARNWAISGGVVGGVAMLGVAALVWAWGQRGPSPEELAQALEKMPTLKFEPVRLDPNANKVTLADGAEVTLADGGEVTLKEGATVSLEEGATVKLDASNFKLPTLPKVADQPAKTADGDKIRREVTVFSHVEHGTGGASIVTGWIYPDGASKRPTSEFCYHTKPNGDGTSQRTDIGHNGQPLPDSSRIPGGFSRCVWWRKGAA